jgi:lysophospholipase L1-like esterase
MDWYEDDVKEVIDHRNQINYAPLSIFYGSSTIRLWQTLYEDFKDYKPINLGFGGSTLAACIWFFDRIVSPLNNPERIILYAGDNDLGDGRHPEEVCLFYRLFLIKLRERYNDIPCYFISIKPSITRIDILDKIEQTNKLIEKEVVTNSGNNFFINVFDKMLSKRGKPSKALFDVDGLHLEEKGYQIWKEVILKECFGVDG